MVIETDFLWFIIWHDIEGSFSEVLIFKNITILSKISIDLFNVIITCNTVIMNVLFNE